MTQPKRNAHASWMRAQTRRINKLMARNKALDLKVLAADMDAARLSGNVDLYVKRQAEFAARNDKP